ncbi:hypothetical protein HA402_009965 [Bradysia odoriphaga]|nr:hypothetical protein HA402_009965 [Bradysia odoriphaga]
MLSGLKILLTGASGLVGSAVTQRLIKSGAQLVMAGKDPQKLRNCDIYGSSDNPPHLWSGDLSNEENCRQLVDFAARRMNGIDVLINNAGVFHFSELKDIESSMITDLMSVNIQTPIYLTRLTLPYLKASPHAMVLNISSLAGLSSLPGGACYAATKWALQGFSHSIREELRDIPIRVCTISPSQVEVLQQQPESTVHAITPEAVADTIALVLAHSRTSSVSLDVVVH